MRRSATGVPTGDFIEDKNAILPIDAAIQSNLRETATRVLEPLTPRVERIFRMRFGIGMNKEHTLEEVGRQFSVPREHIRQIDAKARRKREHPSHSRVLRSDRLVHNALRSLEGESLRKAAAKTTSPASAESAEAAWPRAN